MPFFIELALPIVLALIVLPCTIGAYFRFEPRALRRKKGARK